MRQFISESFPDQKGYLNVTGKDFRFYQADIRDRKALDDIFAKENIEAVIHFAALKAVGYNGYLGLELADAFPKTPEWLAESHAYFTRLIEDR